MAEIVETQSTTLYFGVGSAAVAVPQVFELGPLGATRAVRDVTTLSDTIHKHKVGIPDFVDLEVKIYYDPQDPVHTAIVNAYLNPSQTTWTVNIEAGDSPNEVNTFQAWITNCQVESMGVESDVVLAITLKPQTLPSDMFQP